MANTTLQVPLPKIQVVCCHVRSDSYYMNRLRVHLAPLQQNKQLITLWNNNHKNIGDSWQQDTLKSRDPSHLFLLLISADFIAKHLNNREIQQVIQSNNQGETHFIPILVRPSGWRQTELVKMTVLPQDGEPIERRDSEGVLALVADRIHEKVIESLQPLYVAEAKKYADQERNEEALWIYERALELDSSQKYIPAFHGKGKSLFALGQLEESLNCLKTVIQSTLGDAKRHYMHAEALHLQAKILWRLERYEESLAAYDAYFNHIQPPSKRATDPSLIRHSHPEIFEVYQERIEVLQELERNEEALALYDILIQRDADNAAHYWQKKGDLLLFLEDYDEALSAYMKAIQLDTQQAEYYHKQGELLLRLRRYYESIHAYEKAIDIDPEKPLYYRNLGHAHLEALSYRKALEAYEHCLNLNIEPNPYDYYRKGLAHVGLKEFQQALRAFDMAIEFSGEEVNPQFYYNRGLALAALIQENAELEKQARQQWKNKDTIGFLFIHTIRLEEFEFLYEFPPAHPTLSIAVYRVSFRFDGKWLASASSSGTDTGSSIGLWNPHLATQKPSFLPIGSRGVYDVAFHPDGDVLISGGEDGATLWSVATGQPMNPLPGNPEWVSSVAFSPDGQLLACGTRASTTLWKLYEGTWHTHLTLSEPLTGNLSNDVLSIAFSPDGQLLASGKESSTIRLWNPQTGNTLHVLTGHQGPINSLVFSPNGHVLASGSNDKTIKIWDPHAGQELRTLSPDKNIPVLSLAFSPDGKVLASGNDDTTIKFWDPDTGRELPTLPPEHKNSVLSVAFSPDGQLLASGDADGTIKVWGKK